MLKMHSMVQFHNDRPIFYYTQGENADIFQSKKINLYQQNINKNFQIGQETTSIKNHNKKHYREILCEALTLHMSMIFAGCSSLRNFGPSRQIPRSSSI